MAQVRPVTSEALEAQIRNLLPSQNGFTEDLQASNVITPIIDLTRAAQGTDVGQNLQTAWDFSTGFNEVTATSSTVINNPGFWKVDLTASLVQSFACQWQIALTDGLTSKPIWEFNGKNGTIGNTTAVAEAHFVVFLRAGDSMTAGVSASVNYPINIWYRQIADVNGNLVNPFGFTPQ